MLWIVDAIDHLSEGLRLYRRIGAVNPPSPTLASSTPLVASTQSPPGAIERRNKPL
jgi:hypothetical protein